MIDGSYEYYHYLLDGIDDNVRSLSFDLCVCAVYYCLEVLYNCCEYKYISLKGRSGMDVKLKYLLGTCKFMLYVCIAKL